MPPRIVSREELHSLVWAKPMSQVASEIGITVARLQRICSELDVPYPFSGYWKDPAADRSKLRRLPPSKPGAPASVEVVIQLPAPGAIDEQDVAPIGAEVISAPAPAAPSENRPKLAPEAEPAVPARLAKPHRILVARREEERRHRALWPALYSGSSNKKEGLLTRRTNIIEDMLFKALERRGHSVETVDRSVHDVRLMVAGQRLGYRIRERYKHAREPLSAEERKQPWNVLEGRIDRQVRKMTGELIFTATGARVWPNPTWKDGKKPLEAQIAAIVEGLEALAAKANAQQREDQLAEQRRREEQLRQKELQKIRQRDANQWRRVRELAAQASEAAQVRDFVGKMRKQAECTPANAELLAWLASIEQKADAWDPLTDGADGIRLEITSVSHDHYEPRMWPID